MIDLSIFNRIQDVVFFFTIFFVHCLDTAGSIAGLRTTWLWPNRMQHIRSLPLWQWQFCPVFSPWFADDFVGEPSAGRSHGGVIIMQDFGILWATSKNSPFFVIRKGIREMVGNGGKPCKNRSKKLWVSASHGLSWPRWSKFHSIAAMPRPGREPAGEISGLNVAVDFLREHIGTLHSCFPEGLKVTACPCLNYWHAVDLNVLGILGILWMKEVHDYIGFSENGLCPGSSSFFHCTLH